MTICSEDDIFHLVDCCKEEICNAIGLSCHFFANVYPSQFVENPLFKLLIIEDHGHGQTKLKFYQIPVLEKAIGNNAVSKIEKVKRDTYKKEENQEQHFLENESVAKLKNLAHLICKVTHARQTYLEMLCNQKATQTNTKLEVDAYFVNEVYSKSFLNDFTKKQTYQYITVEIHTIIPPFPSWSTRELFMENEGENAIEKMSKLFLDYILILSHCESGERVIK